jgi:hypothetical protein
MSFQAKSIRCCDCGLTFTFSAGEQEFFHSKGFVEEPKRCYTCRAKKKSQRQGISGDEPSYRSRY